MASLASDDEAGCSLTIRPLTLQTRHLPYRGSPGLADRSRAFMEFGLKSAGGRSRCSSTESIPGFADESRARTSPASGSAVGERFDVSGKAELSLTAGSVGQQVEPSVEVTAPLAIWSELHHFKVMGNPTIRDLDDRVIERLKDRKPQDTFVATSCEVGRRVRVAAFRERTLQIAGMTTGHHNDSVRRVKTGVGEAESSLLRGSWLTPRVPGHRPALVVRRPVLLSAAGALSGTVSSSQPALSKGFRLIPELGAIVSMVYDASSQN